ncbi:hypothetical protein AALP_AA3G014200 [Arabis alpina]|uniref:Uncharacterized protein n=1 Tax=Arabis alpina TaxID=50452 RepID=A0A087H6C4_ARAAL|nr:hypothetical protein AALP_AA3G014200 [Arabis alpina]
MQILRHQETHTQVETDEPKISSYKRREGDKQINETKPGKRRQYIVISGVLLLLSSEKYRTKWISKWR